MSHTEKNIVLIRKEKPPYSRWFTVRWPWSKEKKKKHRRNESHIHVLFLAVYVPVTLSYFFISFEHQDGKFFKVCRFLQDKEIPLSNISEHLLWMFKVGHGLPHQESRPHLASMQSSWGLLFAGSLFFRFLFFKVQEIEPRGT